MILQFAWGLLVITTFCFVLFFFPADGHRRTQALPLQIAFVKFLEQKRNHRANTAELRTVQFLEQRAFLQEE